MITPSEGPGTTAMRGHRTVEPREVRAVGPYGAATDRVRSRRRPGGHDSMDQHKVHPPRSGHCCEAPDAARSDLSTRRAEARSECGNGNGHGNDNRPGDSTARGNGLGGRPPINPGEPTPINPGEPTPAAIGPGGDRQQRQPRRRTGGGPGGGVDPPASGGPAGRPPEPFGLRHLRGHDGAAVLHLVALSCLAPGKLKEIALKLDYSAIYLFIAGTYTPFTLGVLDGSGGRRICALIWGLALTGVFLKTTNRLNHPILSTGLYLVMGWLVLATGGSMIERDPGARRDVAGGRRPVLHHWRRVLCDRDAGAVRPSDLASVRHGRHDVPLFRRTLACGLNPTARGPVPARATPASSL